MSRRVRTPAGGGGRPSRAPARACFLAVLGVVGCLSACGQTNRCGGYPQCVSPLALTVSASQLSVKPGQTIAFTAKASEDRGCRADYAWDFDADGLFDDASGTQVTRRFPATGHHVVAARAADCVGSATGATNVWFVAAPPRACPRGLPFDLVTTSGSGLPVQDANRLPLNPEWNWQCDYAGFPLQAAFPETYGDPNASCNAFTWGRRRDGSTPNGGVDVGPNCSKEITDTDAPSSSDALWYRICHFTPIPPRFQDADQTVHGHVDWRPVTYDGSVKLERIQPNFPFGDRDVDLNLMPSTTQAQQDYTRTPPGITAQDAERALRRGDEPSIHVEFNYDEVIRAFRGATADGERWAGALAALGGAASTRTHRRQAVNARVVGLLGLDVRHGSYTEVHPVYAMALKDAAGAGYARWLFFARNSGTEGGCSTRRDHPLDRRQINLTVPAPAGVRWSEPDSYYAGRPGKRPPVAVTVDGAQATITVGLPESKPGVVAGEIVLRAPGTSARAALARRPPRLRVFPAIPPEGPQEPEDFLAGLREVLPETQRAHANAVPLAPDSRRPLSASKACDLLRWTARRKGARRKATVAAGMVRQICLAAGRPF